MEMGNSVQELVSRHSRRGLRTILVAVAIGVLVLVLIVVGAVLLSSSPAGNAARLDGSSVRLEEVLDGKLTTAGFNGSWVSDNEFLYRDESGRPVLYNVLTNKGRVLIKTESLIPPSTIKLELSADQKFLLAAYNYSKLFRHTYLAQYDIIDIETQSKLTLMCNEPYPDNRILQLVVWAPVGNGLAYIYHNNIYYRPSAAELIEHKLTETGIFNVIYHGVPDWVYEEEVFSSNSALWFSPNGQKLAYASFNDSLTRVMSIPYYGSPTVLEFQYPRAINLRYPKPGTPNPIVSLSVVYLNEDTHPNIGLAPPQDLGREPILSTVEWANDDQVSAMWMNRVQNVGKLVICDSTRSLCESTLDLQEKHGWLDLFVPPKFSSDGSKIILIYPHEQDGGVGAFRHVTMAVRKPSGVQFKPLTIGTFVVTEILAWDENSHEIYFLATDPEDPSSLHLYSVSDEISTAPNAHKCISCKFRTRDGKGKCLYNNKAAFSKNNSFYMHSCSGPDIPYISLYNKKHERLMIWEDNQETRDLLEDRALPAIHRFPVEVPGGFKAQVQVMLPPKIDTSGKTKYPLLVNVYGGPDSYQVTQRFNVDWSTYLTVNKSIIYAAIDGRGSGLKGNRMLFAGYRRLGSVEIDDQVNVTRYLQDRFPYIDKTRTGIWGWSYGGYSTAMALAKDTKGVFKCGISVAPVTDWAYYDTIYTERYMGLPTVEDNLEGYVESELNNKLDNLRHKMFFLVHGTLDDNVHYQQSMMLSKVLEHEDILFRQQSYPDEEHGLAGVRPHLYHSLENFLEECFNMD
ncbi:venom dipeptidyl peptidase 4 [Anabrus simplex]|uniref:venom dipeptidyl peptidase 4 n=1 Tax=Anabrus simplex TaxID=316456 RepID=UPI0035A356FB